MHQLIVGVNRLVLLGCGLSQHSDTGRSGDAAFSRRLVILLLGNTLTSTSVRYWYWPTDAITTSARFWYQPAGAVKSERANTLERTSSISECS